MARIFQRKHDKHFWIDFSDSQGRRHRRRIAPSKRIAEEALNAVLNKVAREEWVGVTENPKTSFADFAKLWAARVLPTVRPRTAKRWSGIVRNHLRPAFKARCEPSSSAPSKNTSPHASKPGPTQPA
jgi:hypothetical protein